MLCEDSLTTPSLCMNLSVQALLLDANNTASLARELFKCGVSSNSQHYSTWAGDLFNQEVLEQCGTLPIPPETKCEIVPSGLQQPLTLIHG